jgi:toxin ParE1/3/4
VKPIIFHDDAQAEFDAAIAYYEMREKGLGLRFHTDVERAARLVNQYPRIGCQYKSTEFRRYVIGRFPYSIFYLEFEDAIWIVSIAHNTRRPDYWKGRQFDRE